MLISLPSTTEVSIYLFITQVAFSGYYCCLTMYPKMYGLKQPFYYARGLVSTIAVGTAGMACLCSMMCGTSSEKTQRLEITWWLGLESSGCSTYLVPGLPTWALICCLSLWFDFLTASWPRGSHTSYMVVQGSKLECYSDQSRATSPFTSPSHSSHSIVATILQRSKQSKSHPHIWGGDMDLSSQWEECQRICSQF